jgi:hypothetical protein
MVSAFRRGRENIQPAARYQLQRVHYIDAGAEVLSLGMVERVRVNGNLPVIDCK